MHNEDTANGSGLGAGLTGDGNDIHPGRAHFRTDGHDGMSQRRLELEGLCVKP